jgi:orotidine-5'-phosphate decarboxylase
MTEGQALKLAERLASTVWGFKVNDLLLEHGVGIISRLKAFGSVFADPKLHDIPNTVANGIQLLEEVGADLITVHASGGAKMLQAAASSAKRAKILAVTALTSLDDSDTRSIYGRSPAETVVAFAELAIRSGIKGIVCSPQELTVVAKIPGAENLTKVTPGIRPAWHGKPDDQSRAATPANAFAQGATLLVIGRPITEHSSPEEAVRKINLELASS